MCLCKYFRTLCRRRGRKGTASRNNDASTQLLYKTHTHFTLYTVYLNFVSDNRAPLPLAVRNARGMRQQQHSRSNSRNITRTHTRAQRIRYLVNEPEMRAAYTQFTCLQRTRSTAQLHDIITDGVGTQCDAPMRYTP